MALPRLEATLQFRDRLTRRLDRWVPLTVLHGPDGAGKTALAAQWASAQRRSGRTVSWFDAEIQSLDCLPSALARLLPGPLVEPPSMSALAGGLGELSSDVLLIVDGFDALPADAALDLVNLVRRCPALHLLLCVRGRNGFVTRATGLVESQVIPARELAFSVEETTAWLAAGGVDTDGSSPEEIHRITGGHVGSVRAGVLQLDGPDAQSRTWSRERLMQHLRTQVRTQIDGADLPGVVLMTWLVGEVIDAGELEELLRGLPASTFDSFRVFGSSEERGNGLALDLAPAMVETLRASVDLRKTPAIEELVAWTIGWLAGSGRSVAGVRLALAAEAESMLVSLLARHWWEVLETSEWLLRDAVLLTPPGESAEHAVVDELRSLLALRSLLDGDGAVGPTVTTGHQVALRELADRDLPSAVEVSLIRLILARLRGDFDVASECAREGAELIERLDRGRREAARRHQFQHGLVHFLLHDFDAAHRCWLKAYAGSEAPDGRWSRLVGGVLALLEAVRGGRAEGQAWQGSVPRPAEQEHGLSPASARPARIAAAFRASDDLDCAAVDRELRAISASADTFDELWFLTATLRAGQLARSGRLLEGLHLLRLELGYRVHLAPPGSLARALFRSTEAELLMTLGRGTEAAGALADAGSSHLVQVTRARLLLLTGRIPQALVMLASVTETRHAYWRPRVHALLLTAYAQHRLGNIDTARRMLKRLMRTGPAPEVLTRAPRSFLEELADGMPELAGALDRVEAASCAPPSPDSLDLVTLTAREAQLLKMLQGPVRREEMAAALFVSTNTVKTQLRVLYGKLGVATRDEAVARAYALGLLD